MALQYEVYIFVAQLYFTSKVITNKISGRLCFDRAELDRVLANGDHKRGRGRPRGK